MDGIMDSCTKCPQKKCSFNIIMGMGCKACEECGCEPNVIDTNCDRCQNCLREEGDLRWGNITTDDKKVEVRVGIKPTELKPIEVKA